MLSRIARTGRRLVPVVLGLMATISAGCATAAARPETAPAAAPTIAASEIPPSPGRSAAIDAAWNELREGNNPIVGEDASADGRALAGFVALRRGDAASALAAFEAALELDSEHARAAYGVGLVALAREQNDVARGWFENALAHDPTLIRAAVQLRILTLDRLSAELRTAEDAERSGDLEGAASGYARAAEMAPDVAPIYLRLAFVNESRGDVDAAVRALEEGRRRAGDTGALLLRLAELYRSRQRYADAYETLRVLERLRPADEQIAALLDETRRLYEESSLPPEYQELSGRDSITREELAAILAIALEGAAPPAGASGAIVSDVGGRWSAPFVERMVAWGVLDVYQNNAFWPDLEVTRSMLVEAVYRAIEGFGLAEQAPRPRLQEPPPEHLLYRPVQTVVGLGIMDAGAGGSFDLLEPVTGQEAIRTAESLASAVRRLGS